MKRAARYLVMAVLCFCFMLGLAQARDLKVSLPYPLPGLVDSPDKGIFVDLLKAMAEEYKGGKITWELFPFARSMENVEKGRVPLDHLFLTLEHDDIRLRQCKQLLPALFRSSGHPIVRFRILRSGRDVPKV